MRYLLSSLLLIICASCASYSKKNNFKTTKITQKIIQNRYFSDSVRDYIYKANIDAFDKSFGGIFIVKKLGENHHRIAFTTETGNKIFDFTFQKDDFTVNYIVKNLDRKILIHILKKDFKVLIEENPIVTHMFSMNEDIIYETCIDNKKHYYFQTDQKFQKIIRTGKGKEKVEFQFSEINDTIAKKIQILHKNIPLKINLKAI